MSGESSSKPKGRLFVVSGPSGVGKGTVVGRLLAEREGLWKSVSATTRSPRPGDVEGEDYFFVEREDFERTAEGGGFLEWAEYSGNLYGTPIASVERKLEEGTDVVLEIEVQGALKVRERMPDAVLVFIAPPSIEELRRRLVRRGTDEEASIERRMKAAEVELSKQMEYDIVFVNNEVDETVKELVDYMDECKRKG